MNPSSNLFIIGPTGAGKTSIGRHLAEHYGLDFIDLDQAIEQQIGVSVSMVFEVEGEAGFRQRESELLDRLSRRANILLATGAGAVLDSYSRQRLAARGYVIWLQASVEQQLERLARDTHRPLLAGEDRSARLAAMFALRTPLYQALADLAVPGECEGITVASERCIELIDHGWQRAAATPDTPAAGLLPSSQESAP